MEPIRNHAECTIVHFTTKVNNIATLQQPDMAMVHSVGKAWACDARDHQWHHFGLSLMAWGQLGGHMCALET